MTPLFDYHCDKCDKVTELFIRKEEKPKCEHCGNTEVRKLMSAFSSYYIKGNNDSSTTPKGNRYSK